ncbi:MAG TPA: hypothetical protein VGK17_07380, partial [Propionicimonas sp.]
MTLPVPVKTAVPSPMGKGTLSRQLVVRTTALVALVTVVLTLFLALASFRILERQLDDRLQVASGRPGRIPASTDNDQNGPADPAGSGLIRLDELSDGIWRVTSAPDSFTKDAASALTSLELSNGPVTANVRGLGLYRVLVVQR